MSLKAIVEIVLHVDSFRNIDLFQQGFYHLQFEVFHMENGNKVSASPYNLIIAETSSKNSLKLPGSIDDIYYKTQSFFIKFYEEEVEINEIAVFRTEIDLNSQKLLPFTLNCNLMFSDLGGRASDKHIRNSYTRIQNFKLESSLIVNIQDYEEGLNQFFPIIFDNNHFCLVSTCLHLFIIDFRYRPSRPVNDLQSNENLEIDIAEVLAESFFPCSDDLPTALVDEIHSRYIHPLSISQTRSALLINQLKKLSDPTHEVRVEDLLILSNETIQALTLKSPSDTFSNSLEDLDPCKVIKKLLEEIQFIASNLHYVLFDFIEVLQTVSRKATIAFMLVYNKEVNDRWGESIFKKITQVGSFTEFAEDNLKHLHKVAARQLRKSEHYKNKELPKVGTEKYFPNAETHPILFLDIFSRVPYKEHEWIPSMVKFCMPNKGKSKHLIVLVHGFQGSSFDVRLIKNQISLLRPDTILMSSHMNEGETEGDILQMGERLSDEITQFIDDWCSKDSLEFISFIGHSLGGLIIRACLPYLKPLSHLFHFFISFSSPHLGYMYNSSKLVGAGMWILKKWKKTESLKQLSMNDSSDPRKSLLFALSSAEGLGWFKHVAFVGAHQDNYAPFESARIEVQHKALADPKGRVYIEMATNILSRVRAEQILRIDCNLKFKKKNLDSMIGRAAHIQMLDNHVLLQMVFNCCAHFFN